MLTTDIQNGLYTKRCISCKSSIKLETKEPTIAELSTFHRIYYSAISNDVCMSFNYVREI